VRIETPVWNSRRANGGATAGVALGRQLSAAGVIPIIRGSAPTRPGACHVRRGLRLRRHRRHAAEPGLCGRDPALRHRHHPVAPSEEGRRLLRLESVNETVNIGDRDGERRMTLSPERRRNRLTEMHTDSRAPIGPERQPVIDE
jgi:hypothetical protein